jgi:hypothetical protein
MCVTSTTTACRPRQRRRQGFREWAVGTPLDCCYSDSRSLDLCEDNDDDVGRDHQHHHSVVMMRHEISSWPTTTVVGCHVRGRLSC